MPKSKFVRVAVEGATVDGRTIDPKWLTEMAETYDRNTYAARVNLEHIRGITAEPPFQALGDVLSLKTEKVDLLVGGKTENRLALFAEIEALEPLVAMNRKSQKLYTSIEINPSFSNSGKAYLMGLAVTDSPASLGTEMLQFAASKGADSPLASRKQQPGNFFSATGDAVTLEFVEDAPANPDPTGIFASIKGLLEKFSPAAPVTPPVAAPSADPATPPAAGDFATLGAAIALMASGIDKMGQASAASTAAMTARLDQIETKLATIPAPNQPNRPPATGVSANFVATDC